MTFEKHARRQAQAMLDGLLQDLTNAAREEAEGAAALARREVEDRAGAELAAARAEAIAQGEAAQAVNTELLSNLDEARRQLRAAEASTRAEVDRIRKEAEATTRAEIDRTRQEAEAATRAEVDRTRREAETATRAEVERTRREAEAAARTELDRTRQELEVRLEEAQERERTLDQERMQLRLVRDESAKLLDSEIQRARELGKTLDSATQAAHAARTEVSALRTEAGALRTEADSLRTEAGALRTEADSLRIEAEALRAEAGARRAESDSLRRDLQEAAERVRMLEEAPPRQDAEARAAVAAGEQAGRQPELLLLEQVGAALQSINAAGTASELLEALVEQLGLHFGGAAVFLVGSTGLKGWRARGLGANRTIKALLTQALADRTPVAVPAEGDDPPAGWSSRPIGGAIALPIGAGGQVMAVAYVEQATGTTSTSLDVGYRVAEILVEHTSRRLATSHQPSEKASAGMAVSRSS